MKNKKILAQLSLGLLVLIIITFSYFKFFKQEKVVKNIDQKPVSKNNNIDGLKYLSNDANGNIYLIEAESGSALAGSSDLIILYNVKAKLNFDEKSQINVISAKAIYNTFNNDTEFLNNVYLDYEDHKISCDKIIAKFSENYAKLSGNLIYNSFSTKLFADQMYIDLFKRTTKTSMFSDKKKVKIIKNNGFN